MVIKMTMQNSAENLELCEEEIIIYVDPDEPDGSMDLTEYLDNKNILIETDSNIMKSTKTRRRIILEEIEQSVAAIMKKQQAKADARKKTSQPESESNQAVCAICGKLVRMRYMTKHMNSHSKHRCEYCSSIFESGEELNKHKEIHPDSEYPCDDCGLTFKTAIEFCIHNHLHVNAFKCPMCSFSTKSRGSIIGHIKRHEGQYNYHCTVCGKGFIGKALLETHEEIHLDIKRYICDVCGKRFTVGRYLEVHRQLNHKKELYGIEELYHCKLCGRKFTFEKSLRRHQSVMIKSQLRKYRRKIRAYRKVPSNKERPTGKKKYIHKLKPNQKPEWYTCKICFEKFTSRKELFAHKPVHDDDNDFNVNVEKYVYDEQHDFYVCNNCSAEFQSKEEVEKHYETHEEKYECNVCNNVISGALNFSCHMQLHRQDKQFPCPLCRHITNRKSAMLVHIMRLHFKKYDFQCQSCGKGFTDASTFKEHENVHLGLKPFTCIVCNKEFVYSRYLVAHQVRNHRVRVLDKDSKTQCHMCSKIFARNETLVFPDSRSGTQRRRRLLRLERDDEYTPPGYRKKRIVKNLKPIQKIKKQEHKIWTCRRCLLEFESRRELTEHTKLYHVEEPKDQHTFKYDEEQDQYTCNTCSAEYQSKKEVEDHISKVHEEFYTCDVCKQTLKKAYSFAVHMKGHSTDDTYTCPLCSYNTLRRTSLQTHINRVHYHKFYFTCATCGKGFNDSVIFREHNNEHLGIKPFVCVVCNKEFVYSRYMLIHQTRYHTVHIEGTLHKTQCSICLKVFSKVATLLKHITTKHSNTTDDKPEKRHLRLELAANNEESVNRMKTRGKSTIKYELREEEIKLETLSEDHASDDEQSDYEYIPRKQKRKKSSTDVIDIVPKRKRNYNMNKTWSCKKCCQTFPTKRNLMNHKKTSHTDADADEHTFKFDELQDLYICNTCSAEYQEQAEVEKHMKTHEEKFQCFICDKTFKKAYDFGIHNAVHNEDKQFHCPLCKYKTSKRTGLLIHINQVHLKKILLLLSNLLENNPIVVSNKDNSFVNCVPPMVLTSGVQCGPLKHQTLVTDSRSNAPVLYTILQLHRTETAANNTITGNVTSKSLYETPLKINPTSYYKQIPTTGNPVNGPILNYFIQAPFKIQQYPLVQPTINVNSGFATVQRSSVGNVLHQTQTQSVPKPPAKYKNPFDYSEYAKNPLSIRETHPSNEGLTYNSLITDEEESNIYQCLICHKNQKCKQSLIDHYEYHKADKDKLESEKSVPKYFECQICSKILFKRYSYDKHMNNVHGDKKYFCSVCDKNFFNAYDFSVHNKKHAPNPGTYICIICKDFSCESTRVLKEHICTDHKNEMHECDICEKAFASPAFLQTHKSIHKDTTVSCTICNKQFANETYRVAHYRNVHPGVPLDNKHECKLCKATFATNETLVKHICSYDEPPEELCTVCGKKFKNDQCLKLHMVLHSGLKKYMCTVCGKSFARSGILAAHLRTHNGEKPYKCETCGKCFSQRTPLVIHQRHHTGERPYVCEGCKRGFVSRSAMNIHAKRCK
ncbi:hypothetical protein NQ315_004263 [Exocentrus adspersus]|uniref:C2H2-type domain-containing protein n=1 Tax=Exocentrus adspersus TaxID=1586481 RepID=A0AAV8W7J1_9CUCU|nr:hypothetical protein NQ315_004263 [Exocentrus adspersus]